jgi:hypothetical protein
MPILNDYAEFEGRHWETGTVRNALAYQGVINPYTEQPISEALLMGLSGGAAFGYFVFDYEGTDPYVALLSRNTFDPLDTLLERMAIPQELLQTTDTDKAERNLIGVLESGRPAIVWADIFGLPYNALGYDEQLWAMSPVVVYGYEDGLVHIADRAAVPLTVTSEELAIARARVKKDRFRVLALAAPNFEKLPAATAKAISQCVAHYTEPPPKGGRDSFGFAAFEKLAKLLTGTRNKRSWERLLPPGRRMYAALAGFGYQPGAFGWSRVFPSNQVDDKRLYADFLDEAAAILKRPELASAGERFRAASAAWRELSDSMLPDEVPAFREARQLLLARRDAFVQDGGTALEELNRIAARLAEIQESVAREFPLSNDQVVEWRARLAEQVSVTGVIEREAVDLMQAAIS